MSDCRLRTCAYQGVRNVRFSENLAGFVFLKYPFLRIAVLSYYRRFKLFCVISIQLVAEYSTELYNLNVAKLENFTLKYGIKNSINIRVRMFFWQ